LLSENHENSKHQKPKLKQIPMTKIQNPKHLIYKHLCQMSSSPANKGFPSDTAQLRCLFWSLDIDPPKAERFICNLVLGI